MLPSTERKILIAIGIVLAAATGNMQLGSARAAGLCSDIAAGNTMVPSDLSLVLAPTLIISARDDEHGTNATAEYTAAGIKNAQFIGFETGGEVWVGHNDEVIAGLVTSLPNSTLP